MADENYNIDYDKAMRWNLLAAMQGGGGGGGEYTAAAPITIDENNAIGLAYSAEDFDVNESGELVSIGGGGAEYTAAAPITIDESNNIGLALDDRFFSVTDGKLDNSIFYIVKNQDPNVKMMDVYNAFRAGKIVVLDITLSQTRLEYRVVQPYLDTSGGRPYILEMYFITRNPGLQASVFRINQNNEWLETVRFGIPEMTQVYTRDELDTKFTEVESYSFNDVKIIDFTNDVSGGTLLPVTSDTPVTNASTGRIDVSIPEEYAADYKLVSLTKWEIKNGDTRVEALPVFAFTMSGQTVMRLGFRTSGTTSKSFDKIAGAMMLKRRAQ